MGNVIDLKNYRSKKRMSYLTKNETRLNRFIEGFINSNIAFDLEFVVDEYLAIQREQNEEAWDYIDLRETMQEALDQVFGEKILAELKKQPWFDPRHISQGEILERCLSAFILGQHTSIKTS